MNSFYNHGSTPVFRSQGLSSLIRAEFDAITAGFNKLPTLSAGVARRLVAVNAAGDALETIFNGYHGAGNPTVLPTNTALGVSTLAANTTGYGNTAFGYQCLSVNTSGPVNTAIGANALAANTTGSSNTALGSGVLILNTTGSGNTGLGAGTLQTAVNSSHNTAVGNAALALTTNSENTAMGYLAGWRITTGQYNTIVGSQAVYAANVTASGMTAVGYDSLAANVSGAGLVAVGYQALLNNTASYNTAVGYSALLTNVSGTRSTAVGYQALTLATGNDNTSVGYNALSALTTGTQNVAIGSNALAANVNAHGNVAIGYSALAAATGNTAGSNVVIGNGAAAAMGGVSPQNVIIGAGAAGGAAAAVNNVVLGFNAAPNGSNFGNNVVIGYLSGASVDTNSYCVLIGRDTEVTSGAETNSTAIGYGATITASNQMVFGNTSVTDNVFHGRLTTTEYFGMNNDAALAALVATGMRLSSNATYGALLVGYGTTSDVWIGNRNGTRYIAVDANGAQLIGGTLKTQAGTGTGRPVVSGVLSVNTTAVGNIGGGTDDLMTYTLPANSLSANGKGVRVTAWGTAANNAASKTLKLWFGGTAFTIALTANQALNWKISANILRTGASTQLYNVEIRSGTTTTLVDNYLGNSTLGETDTADIVIKCTAAATNDNDVVQTGMLVEFIN